MHPMSDDVLSPLVMNSAKAILWLRGHGPHGLLKSRIPCLSQDPAIEYWSLGCLGLSLLAFVAGASWLPIAYALGVIGLVRLLEILVNAIHVTLFHGLLDKKPLAGTRRIVILLLLNYLEVVLWFAFAYRAFHSEFDTFPGAFSVAALAFSLSVASGFGDVPVVHHSTLITALSVVQSAIGLFMALAVLARFIALLPKPPGPKGKAR
jgi:hypothetical protein